MIAYVMDSEVYGIKDMLQFDQYEFKEDIDYAEKSQIVVARKPNIANDDFILCKDGNDVVFVGICDTFDSSDDAEEYRIQMLQKENLFDETIFVENESVIKDTGIEDFIVLAIENNFSESGDVLMDKSYITVSADTHTPIAAKVDSDDGTFNLKTYLGNAKQYYGIYLDYHFSNDGISIVVKKKEEDTLPVDTTVSDISSYKETYEVNVLAKLSVKWKIPDTEGSEGNVTVGAETRREFYLLSDRTISENISHADRAAGIRRSIRIEAETEDEMLQQVYNEFAGNQYNHKIQFDIKKDSQLYDASWMTVGRKCMIKTKSGIRASMITKTESRSDEAVKRIVFGNLKVTLIEKLRGR